MLKVKLSDIAEADMAGAIEFYEDISLTLGDSFDKNLDAALDRLCQLPDIG
jgi:plasmid stabilization system protein ParE